VMLDHLRACVQHTRDYARLSSRRAHLRFTLPFFSTCAAS
jgi:hypothetical protein